MIVYVISEMCVNVLDQALCVIETCMRRLAVAANVVAKESDKAIMLGT